MNRKISAFQNILESLFNIQRSAWLQTQGRWKPSTSALRTYKALEKECEPITFENIQYQFKLPEFVLNFSDRVLYLPPLKKDPNFVPVLSLRCKLTETQSKARFRVMLISSDKDDNFRGIGFRLETPEGQNQDEETPSNEGTHDFHHAQLIHTLNQTKLDSLQIDCPSWLPQQQPSFPMPAKGPVTLLLCLIVTLYGREGYKQFFKTYINDYRRSDVEHYKTKLDPWINCTSSQQANAPVAPTQPLNIDPHK